MISQPGAGNSAIVLHVVVVDEQAMAIAMSQTIMLSPSRGDDAHSSRNLVLVLPAEADKPQRSFHMSDIVSSFLDHKSILRVHANSCGSSIRRASADLRNPADTAWYRMQHASNADRHQARSISRASLGPELSRTRRNRQTSGALSTPRANWQR